MLASSPTPQRPPLQPRNLPGAHIPLSPAFQRLATHMDIGWDLDGTLLDHPAAPALHSFIRRTPHIRHSVITFRSACHVAPLARLAGYPDAPGAEAFAAVIHMPDQLAPSLAAAQSVDRRSPWPRFGRLLPFGRRAEDQACRTWKGEACRQRGITALVDDMTALVAEGCQRHGVDLFHPSDFLMPH